MKRTLQEWIEWAEEMDGYPSGEYPHDYENEFNQYETELVEIKYVQELVQQVRELKIDTEQFLKLLNKKADAK